MTSGAKRIVITIDTLANGNMTNKKEALLEGASKLKNVCMVACVTEVIQPSAVYHTL